MCLKPYSERNKSSLYSGKIEKENTYNRIIDRSSNKDKHSNIFVYSVDWLYKKYKDIVIFLIIEKESLDWLSNKQKYSENVNNRKKKTWTFVKLQCNGKSVKPIWLRVNFINSKSYLNFLSLFYKKRL